MSWQRPSPRVVWRAIETYLEIAYTPLPKAETSGEQPRQEKPRRSPSADATPSAVRARLETLKSTPPDAFYDSPVFETQEPPRTPGDLHAARDVTPIRYALRLGNLFYPHMKFIIERSPDGAGYLLRADTHDAHIQPRAGSREQAAFNKLMQENRTVADIIEGKWEEAGLPTFKKFLREDLDRRKAAAGQ